jgi:F0F1-type ATP synthase delta subunit
LKVSLMPEIDNEILGGIIVKINNQVWDYSISGQIRQMSKEIMEGK